MARGKRKRRQKAGITESNLLTGTFISGSNPEIPPGECDIVYAADDVVVRITPQDIVIDFTATNKPDVVVARQANND